MPSFYSSKELIVENLANAAAGVTLLPDISIIKFLETNISFPKLAEPMQMSQAALYIRLVQFLEHQLQMNNEHARKQVNQLRYYGKRDSINRCLIGAYSNDKKKEIISFYENSL